jgi:rhomboid family GlyGly-CTERM serine protease
MQTRSYAKHMTNLSHSLQWDGGRWMWLTLILLAGAGLLGLGDNARSALRYERDAIGAGQWWRLLSAHAVHQDAHHFALNALGLVLVWALFAREFRAPAWLTIVAGGALGISAGLWRFDPQVQWYLGASGVLHSVMGAGCMKRLLAGQWDRWLLCGGLIVKLALEQHAAPPAGVALPVIVDAHLYGAVAGAAIAAAICGWMAIIRR